MGRRRRLSRSTRTRTRPWLTTPVRETTMIACLWRQMMSTFCSSHLSGPTQLIGHAFQACPRSVRRRSGGDGDDCVTAAKETVNWSSCAGWSNVNYVIVIFFAVISYDLVRPPSIVFGSFWRTSNIHYWVWSIHIASVQKFCCGAQRGPELQKSYYKICN